MIEIRKAVLLDLEQIELLYNDLCDYLEVHENYPGWKKGVYPTREDAEKGIREESLFVVEKENKIVGTFILSHKLRMGTKMSHGLQKMITHASMSYIRLRFTQAICNRALEWRF